MRILTRLSRVVTCVFVSVRIPWTPWALATMLACLPSLATASAGDPAPRLSSDTEVASAGFYRLMWETHAERVELQEAADPEFRHATTPYRGPDRATVISGKPNGTWYYRVRAADGADPGAWSPAVTVTVAHHSLARALMFLSLGVIVFVATATMIIRGTRSTQ